MTGKLETATSLCCHCSLTTLLADAAVVVSLVQMVREEVSARLVEQFFGEHLQAAIRLRYDAPIPPFRPPTLPVLWRRDHKTH